MARGRACSFNADPHSRITRKGTLSTGVNRSESAAWPQLAQYAGDTPYETRFVSMPAAGQRVLPEEVAATVRRSLIDVVQGGTAIRLKGGITSTDGHHVEMGGKTGTGDQRFETYARSGRLIESRAVNRSATFVFLIGDRFFGTITAYVHEPFAADYGFTSALTVQLLKSLMPTLQPLLKNTNKAGPPAIGRA